MANSVDPDQTAPLGAVWSGSALFAQAYLSENLGSLQYQVSVLTAIILLSIYPHHYRFQSKSKLHIEISVTFSDSIEVWRSANLAV